jgi:hypothetical protein
VACGVSGYFWDEGGLEYLELVSAAEEEGGWWKVNLIIGDWRDIETGSLALSLDLAWLDFVSRRGEDGCSGLGRASGQGRECLDDQVRVV